MSDQQKSWVSAPEVGQACFCPMSLFLRRHGARQSASQVVVEGRGELWHAVESAAAGASDKRFYVASYLYGKGWARGWVFVLGALFLPGHALGDGRQYCFEEAGVRYGVSPRLLYAIGNVESDFDPRAREVLPKSESIGVMMINSVWYETLLRYGIRREDLWEPCTNINVGAWVLAQCIAKYGNSWTAVGCYNAGDVDEKSKVWKSAIYIEYAKKVYDKLQRLQDTEPKASAARTVVGSTKE